MTVFPILAKLIRVFYVKTRISGISGPLKKPYSIEKELKIRSFLGKELAVILGGICVSLMSCLRAILVYKHSRKLLRTFELSIDFLKAGKALLIFAESDVGKERDDLCMLDTGFVRVAQWLYAKTRKIATFYPVMVNKHVPKVRVGRLIRFDPGNPIRVERERIKVQMERRMTQMYSDMECSRAVRAGH